MFDKSVYGKTFSSKPLERGYEREPIAGLFSQDALSREP